MGMPEKINAAIQEFREEVQRNYGALLRRIVELEARVTELEKQPVKATGRRDTAARVRED